MKESTQIWKCDITVKGGLVTAEIVEEDSVEVTCKGVIDNNLACLENFVLIALRRHKISYYLFIFTI